MDQQKSSPMLFPAIGFGAFILYIIFEANRGQLPESVQWYRSVPGSDTTSHFLLIGTLALLVNLAWRAATMQVLGVSVLRGTFWVALFVVLEELSQMALPTRTFSLLDLSADLLGIALASFIVLRMKARSARLRSSESSR